MSKADFADRPANHDATAPWTSGGAPLILTPSNIHAQIAAGAPLNVTSGFNAVTLSPNGNVGYTTQIVLGAGGANPVVYTVTGTWGGSEVTEQITATGAGTYEGSQPFDSITSLTSDVNPAGTTDLQTLDPHFFKPVRGVWVGGVGALTVLLAEDTADIVIPTVPVSTLVRFIEIKRLRCDKAGRSGITATSATLLVVGR